MQHIYQQLWSENFPAIQRGEISMDSMLNQQDIRSGLTLRFRPTFNVIHKIKGFLHQLKSIAPNQYFYLPPSIHLTVSSVISCHANFDIESIEIAKYVAVIKASLKHFSAFPIEFKGITVSKSSVLIQGFVETDKLNQLRKMMKIDFQQSELMNTIDIRYPLQTAHLTVIRFKKKLGDSSSFAEVLNSFRTTNFGTTMVDSLELVHNDWYHREDKTKILREFELKSN